MGNPVIWSTIFLYKKEKWIKKKLAVALHTWKENKEEKETPNTEPQQLHQSRQFPIGHNIQTERSVKV